MVSDREASQLREEDEDRPTGITELDVPEPIQDKTQQGPGYRRTFLEDEGIERAPSAPVPTKEARKEWLETIVIYSWLIFFSIWGALARLGLSALTKYPGSPVGGLIWANFAGCFVMGFTAEEVRFFAPPGASRSENGTPKPSRMHNWSSNKKAIPLYIGITTGFCGSLTSFSSWMRDSFLHMSNTQPAYPRHKGYNVEAMLAELIATVALSVAGIKSGAHLALFLRPYIPTMPTKYRFHLDILGVILGIGCWIGATLMAGFRPRWRGEALFASVFAPLGTLVRFIVSKRFNTVFKAFPLGTFLVNVAGSMIDAGSISLQHYSEVQLVGCEVLRGLEDGFCGCLTTVSTWAVEIASLRRKFYILENCPDSTRS